MSNTPYTRLANTLRPELRQYLMDSLYEKDTCAARDALIDIYDKHCELTGQIIRGFSYMGKTHYPRLGQEYNHRDAIHVLHPSLHANMDAWLADRRVVEKEEKLIVQNLITAILNTSDSADDWERLLPPALHGYLQRYISFRFYDFPAPKLTDEQVAAFEKKQERFLNILKGRLALNLIF